MKNRPLCSICLCFCLMVCIGTVLGGERFVKELRPSPAEMSLKEDDEILLSGKVYQKADKEKYQILYLKDNSINYHQQSLRESRLIIYDEEKCDADIGDILTVQGSIGFFENARNPGNFDRKLYYQKQDIHASVWAESVSRQGNVHTRFEDLKNCLCQFRQRWKECLCKVLGEKDGNTLSAMLLGEKGEMDEEVRELYQANGIGHVLAISGLHLSFIGVGIYKFLRRLSGSYAVGGAAGILFLSLYIVMIGLTVSALRAMIMFFFRVGADMAGRNYDSMTALAFSGAAVLVWRPLSVYDGGFWLSFGAVLAVILVLPAFRDFPAQGIWASVSINLVVLPVLLYYFYEFPVYAVFLNLLVIPMMSAVLFLGIGESVVYAVLPAVGEMVLRVCRLIFFIYEQSCRMAMGLPGARAVTGKPEVWQVVVYYACFFGALAIYSRLRRHGSLEKAVQNEAAGQGRHKIGPAGQGRRENEAAGQGRRKIKTTGQSRVKKQGKKGWQYGLPLLLLAAGLFLLTFRFGENGKLCITVLDVGQGDGIYIRGPEGGRFFIDGGSSDVKNAGKYRIEPFLKSQGTGTLDYVFISHGDSDHISGVEEMLERKETGVSIRNLVLPVQEVWDDSLVRLAGKAMDSGTKVSVMERGKVFKEGGMSLACLAPDRDFSGEKGNAASMALLLSYGEFDMLFTGDIEGPGEEALTETMKKNLSGRSIEILKAAHHGSKNSSTEGFLEEVRPGYTLISAGIGNRYGHPHEEAVERFFAAGSKVYSTQENGAIIIEVKKKGDKRAALRPWAAAR